MQKVSVLFYGLIMAFLYEIIVIIILNLLCYYSTLPGEFVFDDSVAILKNKDVSNKISQQSLKVNIMNENSVLMINQLNFRTSS